MMYPVAVLSDTVILVHATPALNWMGAANVDSGSSVNLLEGVQDVVIGEDTSPLQGVLANASIKTSSSVKSDCYKSVL
jgi:hypothetical protein